MHGTESIDYVMCLAGKIDMDMDDSTVTMEAGDLMVQRDTNHAWVNRYEETTEKEGIQPKVIAAIRIGDTPEFSDHAQEIVYRLPRELYETRFISDAIYERALDTRG